MEISRIAFNAHNQHKEEPCFNEEYNTHHKLGSIRERAALIIIALEEDRQTLTPEDLIGTGHSLG